jgi:hypothetical protein
MRRAGLIVAAAVGGLSIAAAALWLVAFRDTADPVSVGEAVTSFRSDTEPAPHTTSPIPEGVYVYATHGYERTDALNGVVHRYPRRSTIAVRATGCGITLTWRVLEGRSTRWTNCVTPAGWMLHSQDERHTFFGHTQRTTYVCEDTFIRPVSTSVGDRWSVSCTTGDTLEKGTASVVGTTTSDVGGSQAELQDIAKSTAFTGSIRGTSQYDFWFDRTGVPVRIVMISHTTNGSPIGDVHYSEVVTLRLLSLEPRR